MADNYYQQLAASRGLEREYNQIMSAASDAIKPPSGGRYAMLYFIAIVGDILDFATGVSIVVDLILFIPFTALGHKAKKKTDAMNELTGDLVARVEQIEKTVMAMRRTYAGALKTARRFKSLRRPAARLAGALRFGKKSRIFMRTFLSAIADLTPNVFLISLLPLRTWSVYSSKKEERAAYERARELLPLYASAAQERVETINYYNEALAPEAA